jgi:ferredoxin
MTKWLDIVHNELNKCTDCGLCLSSCPTFVTSRDEGESPRGRRHLIQLAIVESTDSIASQHLAGCLECGACHTPCPTGVRIAVARRAHRADSEQLDQGEFAQKINELEGALEDDSGARLTMDSIRDLLTAPVSTYPGQWRSGDVLPLIGPMLRRAGPEIVAPLLARLSRATPAVMHDPALVAALERAGGLLLDAGLVADHEQSLSDVVAIAKDHHQQQVTVAVFDHLMLRLRDLPLPPSLRIVPAHEVFPILANIVPQSAVWDHGSEQDLGIPTALSGLTTLPEPHRTAAAPVLLSEAALATLRGLLDAKRAWLGERVLVSMDSRTLLRFPGSRHLAEFLAHPRAS